MPIDWSGSDIDFNLEIEFDLDYVTQGVNKLKKIGIEFNNAIDRGIDNAAKSIYLKLITILNGYGLPQLVDKIKITKMYMGFEIRVDSDQAIYVEYGTGIRGQQSPHPKPEYEYDINGHGNKGWYAPLDELGSYPDNPYKLPVRGGEYFWTKGMPARPYMYALQMWIKSYGIITRSIRKELRKIKV